MGGPRLPVTKASPVSDEPNHPTPHSPDVPWVVMTRAAFEDAADDNERVCEWLGVVGHAADGEPLGRVWPRPGYAPGGTRAGWPAVHSRVSMNLTLDVLTRVDRDAWCVAAHGMEVGCPTGRTRLPDLALAREPVRHLRDSRGQNRVVLNAGVIFEVLSPATRSVDLADKAADYLSVPTVTDYIIVDPARVWVQHRVRADATPGSWRVHTYEDAADAVTVADPALTLPLSGIYARVPAG